MTCLRTHICYIIRPLLLLLLLQAVKDVYLPDSGLWVSEYPHVDRTQLLEVSLQVEREAQEAEEGQQYDDEEAAAGQQQYSDGQQQYAQYDAQQPQQQYGGGAYEQQPPGAAGWQDDYSPRQ